MTSKPLSKVISMNPLEISCQDVKSKLDANEEFLFLDCREPDEYKTAKIEGATLLPMSEMVERVGELEDQKQKPIVVHCHHGGRSMQVTQWLKQQGYADVKSMAGGIDVWSKEIDPAVPRY